MNEIGTYVTLEESPNPWYKNESLVIPPIKGKSVSNNETSCINFNSIITIILLISILYFILIK
jgi:hypothetical protein